MRKMNVLSFMAMIAVVVSAMTSVQADDEERTSALARVMERGVLEVAVYKDFPPFSFRDKAGRVVGIDADIARALAERLGVAAAIRAVGADESMGDDLRNNVWKGHYLGGGVADLMLHVPYDKAFAQENDRAVFIAPYYREQIIFAVNRSDDTSIEPLDLFTREKVGVELDTLADFYLLSAYGGQIREQVVHFRNLTEAVTAFKNGELAGVAGPRSEIEFALGEARETYRLGAVKMPGLRRSGWDLGGAVKQGNTELAQALDQAMSALREEGELKTIFERYQSTYQLPSRLSRLEVKTDETVALSDDSKEMCKQRL